MTSAAIAPFHAACTGPDLTTITSTDVAMDTLVTVRVDTARPRADALAALDRALLWFIEVETICSRFDPASELVALSRQTGIETPVSPLLFEAVAFAIEVASLTGGAFDPTIGAAQQQRGFNRHYVPGKQSPEVLKLAEPATFRDVRLDRRAGTVLLRRPLLLDLGAVAKGLAIDLAAKELAGFERYAVDAGGDVYAGAASPEATPWRIGVRHPQNMNALLQTIQIRNASACTSGGYERPAHLSGEHHLLDPRTGRSPRRLSSVTVVAPTAMVADALATAVFVLGPNRGLRLLRQQRADGLLLHASGEMSMTPGFEERVI